MLASLAATVALALLPSAQGMWIVAHKRGGLVQERSDPIVNFGTVASHVHTVVGASNFGPSSTPDSIRQSSCSTSPVQADKSNYWAPQLYHKNSNGTYSAITTAFVNTYYLNRDGPNTKKISAFPTGLKMLAGNPYRTTYNASSRADQAVSYVCLNYNGVSTGPNPTFPTSKCVDGMRAQIVFPSCWDGKNLDSSDHKSHMAYPIQAVDSGDCPSTHPNKLITLFYEFVFDVNQFDGVGSDAWVWASGAGEYGFHADFMDGWDTPTLQAAVDQCTGLLFQDLKSCPPFVATIDEAKANACTKESVVEEDVGFDKALSRLPGCNPVPNAGGAASCPGLAVPAIVGGAPGTPGSSSAAPASPSSTVSASAASSSAPASTDAPASSSVAAAPSSSSSTPAPAPTTSQASSSAASAASSTASTDASSASTSAPASSPGAPAHTLAPSLPANSTSASAPASAPHGGHGHGHGYHDHSYTRPLPTTTASAVPSGHVNIGASHPVSVQPLPTSLGAKPTGSCKSPTPGAAPAKRKRAAHAHVKRHLNRLSY